MIAPPFRRTLPVLLVALILSASIALSQNPAASAPQAAAPGVLAQHMHHDMGKPVNLQVLPKDTSGEQVIQIMRHFTGDLGVECGFCHAKSPETGRLDFPSDANPMKDAARVMMRMTHTINVTYLTQLTVPKPAEPVTCGTCHRGMAEPAVFVPQPREHGPHPAMPVTPPPN